MRPGFSTLLILATLLSSSLGPTAAAQQDSSERFRLRGKVINTATGEPVSGALVQIPLQVAQFTDSGGAFTFSDLQRGNFAIEARKPGFFNERELGQWDSSLRSIPSGEDAILQLTPEGVIFGQVKNEDGQPMEAITVRAQRWQVINGRRQLEAIRQVITDDQGNFRIAELVPGKYYLAFVPAAGGYMTLSELKPKAHSAEGYGPQFYPAGSDLASASVLPVGAGQQLHIAENLARQRLFEVSGYLRGISPGDAASLTVSTPSGETPQRELRLNPKTGEFQILGIPAGTYMLLASGSRPPRGQASAGPLELNAMLPIQVGGDLSGVVLTLGTGISAAVQLRDEISNANPGDFHQVYVRMTDKEFQQFGPGIVIPAAPGSPRAISRFENISPGTYTVEATPQGVGYVASLRCGGVDLLRDDLTIPPGAAPQPIEITLRNDGAQLNVTLVENSPLYGVVIYSPDYPRRSLLMPVGNRSLSFSVPNLPPGTYRLIALKNVLDLEFRNPAAMEKYLPHATVVTLEPGDDTTVRLEAQQPAGEP
jgi:uncharacterized protein (DUF2141 family)